MSLERSIFAFMDKLLTRDEFRSAVFSRDNNKCVICGEPAVDAHHIIERRLFTDGGYYIDNGASLCSGHHLEAEMTVLSCSTIRESIGITKEVLPEHLYDDFDYDKWGNILLPSGQRLKGELFYDESVQKILREGNVLGDFIDQVKYPRTHHLPWSSLLKDDRFMESDKRFVGQRVIVTLKMDGENTTMYRNYIHARSISFMPAHESRSWVKGLWGKIKWMIDENMRICGENLYALHSVHYTDLPSYFMVFSIWVDNTCLSWDETVEYARILDLHTVPVIYDGVYSKEAIEWAFKEYSDTHEGYVVRLAEEFSYPEFRHVVGKFVRPEFRQVVNNSHGHWISKKVVPNKLSGYQNDKVENAQ